MPVCIYGLAKINQIHFVYKLVVLNFYTEPVGVSEVKLSKNNFGFSYNGFFPVLEKVEALITIN